MISGPVANDTIYDTWGITTSGLLKPAEALQILSIGPEYRQIVLKTEKAAGQLHFDSAQIIPEQEISSCRETVRKEEAAFQEEASAVFRKITKGWDTTD